LHTSEFSANEMKSTEQAADSAHYTCT